MTTDQLVDRIKSDAWREVRVKRGRTNGRPVLHVIDCEARKSRTLKSLGDWMIDPLNPRNRPQNKRQEPEDGFM